MLGTSLARKKPHRAAVEADPTPERMSKAGDDFELGDDGRGRKTLTVRDAPLERALARKAITHEQYQAGIKYRHHWYHAGLSGIGSIDLNRVFSAESAYGMARTEAQYFHRQRYREAVDRLDRVAHSVLDQAICQEVSLE